MTFTLFWAFTIATFLSGSGATCGLASSPEYLDQATCEEARQAFETQAMIRQTPTRRISTLGCELRVKRL